MAEKAFAAIEAGLLDAIALGRDEPGRGVASYYPLAAVDIQSIRRRTGLSQELIRLGKDAISSLGGPGPSRYPGSEACGAGDAEERVQPAGQRPHGEETAAHEREDAGQWGRQQHEPGSPRRDDA